MTRGPVTCNVLVDILSPPLNEPPSIEQQEARATALAEMDAWAEKVLIMPLYNDQFIPQGVGKPTGPNINNLERANYVAYLRVVVAIQQLALVPAGAIRHPKFADIDRSLKVWANNCWKAAEPGTKVPYNVEKGV